MDVLTPQQRKRCMSAIKSKHTKPEVLVRMVLRRLGYHYQLHVGRLPGRPEIVIPKQKLTIFVHGCFWHCHRCRYGRVTPKTNVGFWKTKRLGNVERDKRNSRTLRKSGWRVMTVWECWTKKPDELAERLANLLHLKY
jgi:DNA mismatch endonuclease (patch repair protein)